MRSAADVVRPLRADGYEPCVEAMELLEAHPEWTIADAWQACERVDWMIWLLYAAGIAEFYRRELMTFTGAHFDVRNPADEIALSYLWRRRQEFGARPWPHGWADENRRLAARLRQLLPTVCLDGDV